MATFSLRFVLSGLAACATVVIVGTSALPAAAATGNTGAGGGAFAGDTLVATAWETSVDPFTEDDGVLRHAEDTDLYNYRIGLEGGQIIDFQPTDGFEGLTAAEQDQWYVDAGLAPYEFDWFAFYCPAARLGSLEPTAKDSDAGINLVSVPYHTVAEQIGYPAFTGSEFNDWYNSVVFGWTFAADITSTFDSDFLASTVTEMLDSSNIGNGINAVLATSYLNFTCPDGYAPLMGRVLNSSASGDYAVDRSLVLGSSMFVEPVNLLNSPVPIVEVSSAGTYIAVTGQASVNANASLWGVSYVNDGTRALPNTGRDSSSFWAMTAGAATLALVGLGLVALRRKTAR